MIYRKPVSVGASKMYSGLASSVKFRILDASRETLVDWTNEGVTELVASSGLYGSSVWVDTSWGECEEQWKIEGTNFAATRGFNAARIQSSGYINPVSGLYPVSVAFGPGSSGLAPYVQLKVVAEDSSVVRDWSSEGVVELRAGSGLYGAEIALLSSYGVCQLLWRIDLVGHTETASQELDAEALFAGQAVLSERQELFYLRSFDVWWLADAGAGPLDGTEGDRATYFKVYENIKGRMQSTHFNQRMEVFGRTDAPNAMTYNDFHAHCSYDIRGGYVLVETSSGVVSRQNAFVCVGVGEVRPLPPAEYTHVWVTRFPLEGTNLSEVYP